MHAEQNLAGDALSRQAVVGGVVAGTLVHTKEGLKPIEQIKIGDWVLSRPKDPGQGLRTDYKRVAKTFRFENREVIRFVGGRHYDNGTKTEFVNVFSTPHHPVWSAPHGWVAMGRMHMVGRGIPGTIPNRDDDDNEWFGRDLVLADGDHAERYDVFRLFQTDRADIAFDDENEDSWGLGSLVDFSGPSPRFISGELVYDYEKWGNPDAETRKRYATTVYNLEVEDWHSYFVGKAGLWVHDDNPMNPAL